MRDPSPPYTAPDVQQTLEWFLHNVELQLDDEEIAAKGVRTYEYWDTADVRRAVLGLEEFFDNETVNVARFKEKKTLVTCLAAEGWLGPVRLLEPHQAEFAKSLHDEFGLYGRKFSESRVDQFLYAVGFKDDHKLSLHGFAHKSIEEKEKIVSRYAGKAEMLFKAVQCVHGTWKGRLATMYKEHLLDLSDSGNANYRDIFCDPLFRDLREQFDKHRRERTKNNVADATCICLLQRQVERFNKGESNELPHFFASRSLFGEILRDIKAAGRLTYIGYEGREYSIFRDLDYYVFKATFRPNPHVPSTEKPTNSVDTLKGVRDTLVKLLEASKKDASLNEISIDVLNRIAVNGHRLGDLIFDLRGYWFLERVWLPYAASEAISKAAASLAYEQSTPAEKEALQKSVDEAIDRATAALDKNADEYRWFSDLWIGLKEQATYFRSRFDNRTPAQDQIYRLWGLGRFGVPDRFRRDIEASVAGLVLGDEDSVRRELAHISQMCIDVKQRQRNEHKTILLSVLWTLEMDSAIRAIGVDYSKEETWVVAIAAASATRAGQEQYARKALRDLEARYQSQSASDPVAATTLAISIAYIHFHLWRQNGGTVAWRESVRTGSSSSKVALPKLIEKAIEYAEIAYQTEIEDTHMRVYVLNMLLYYITEGGSDAKFRSMQPLSHELLRWRQELNIWQYRFDDTLARYFHRRSVLQSDVASKQQFLELARRYIQFAVRDSYGDADVADYETLLIDMAHALN